MTTSYTPILKLALPVTGELVGTWGDIVNNSITSMVEEAVAGLATINVWAGSPPTNTLTVVDGAASTSRCAILECSGTPGAAAFVVCPAQTKFYIVSNSVAGGYDVTLKTAAGTGIVIPNGKAMLLYCDGTNVVEGASYVETAGGLKSNASSGVAQITGPAAGSTRTYTLPNANATILTTNAVVTVPQGGTGNSSLTDNALLVGNGANAIDVLPPGAAGEIVVSTGSAWASGPVSASAVVSFSGGTTGLTPSSPTTGAVTLGGALVAANGGTGLTSPGASGNFLRSTGAAWESAFVPAGFANMQVFTSSTTWTIPAGVNNVRITVIGGGGGGGGAGTYSYPSGFPVSPGGSGGTSSVTSGTQTITAVTATGGGGGTISSATAFNGGTAGVGTSGSLLVYGNVGGTSAFLGGSLSRSGDGGSSALLGAGGGAGGYNLMSPGQSGYAYGGGGGGGVAWSSGGSNTPYEGGGGGGGAVAYRSNLTPGNTLTVSVGSGGSAGGINQSGGPTPSGAYYYSGSGGAGASGVVIIEY